MLQILANVDNQQYQALAVSAKKNKQQAWVCSVLISRWKQTKTRRTSNREIPHFKCVFLKRYTLPRELKRDRVADCQLSWLWFLAEWSD
jgi:hypothetical protein